MAAAPDGPPAPPLAAAAASGPAALTVAQVRTALLNHGWGQGCVLPDALRAHVQRIPFAPAATDDEIAIVITQDCDAINGDCAAEPALEVALACSIAKIDPDCKVLRHPRRLHVDLLRLDGTRQPVEVSVWRRGFIARELLVTTAPAQTWRVPDESLGLIVDLFRRRVDRVAFPDAFMGRFKAVAQRLEQVVATHAAAIASVHIALSSWEELSSDESYGVTILLLASTQAAANLEALEKLGRAIKPQLLAKMQKAQGLHDPEVLVLAPSQVTLADILKYEEWDHEALRIGLMLEESAAAITAAPAAPAPAVPAPGLPPSNPLD